MDGSCKMTASDPWRPLSDTYPQIPSPIMDPKYNLISSEKYLESLEKKLHRLKGGKKDPTAREIIRTLHTAKNDLMERLMKEAERQTPAVSEEDSAQSFLMRKLHPERQAINTEELVLLLQDDDVAKRTKEEREIMCGETEISAVASHCTDSLEIIDDAVQV